jgi:hypothetical protein
MAPMCLRFAGIAMLACAAGTLVVAQAGQLKTAAAVLERYQHALGGANVIGRIASETRRGDVEATGLEGKATLVAYTKRFKSLRRVRLPDGREIVSGFDGRISWSITPQGAVIDETTSVDAARRDTDLQYALHQPNYFQKLELAGVTDFEGRPCYWLRGTTQWGKDNNQYYDVKTGLLAGYRFQSDDAASADVTTQVFEDYKSFGGPLVATKVVSRTGNRTQTVSYASVTYESLADSLFDLPEAVRALLK